MIANVLFFGILFQNCSKDREKGGFGGHEEHRGSGPRTEIEKKLRFSLEQQDPEQLSRDSKFEVGSKLHGSRP